MQRIDYPRVRETLYQETLPNGLGVYLFPKPGFAQLQAMFTTDYGSIDSHFKLADEPDAIQVPDGIAHFLEHKMFESQGESVFNQFARYGASMNAFTSFTQTTYYFSSTANPYENMKVLLDFVQDPYFTDENVNKEKGIIEQEIRMGQDNPDRRSYYGLLQALYQEHPVRIEIAGTVESIYEIDRDTLYRCYRTFYHPSNMMLCVAGGFDPDEMMNFVRENQAAKSFGPTPTIERLFPQEPKAVAQPQTVAKLSVSQPRCMMGWKDGEVGLTGRRLLEQDLLTSVMLDALFGSSSSLYHQLIDDKVTDQQFSWEYEITPNYGYSMVGGNTPDPAQFQQRVWEAIHQFQQSGVPPEAFERCRKKLMGWFLTTFDSPGQLARQFTSFQLKQADLFDAIDILSNITLDAANQRLREHFTESACAASIVLPSEP